jgi:hypothetical protein
MATKKKTAVGKAAKAPTAEHLTAQIRSDKAKVATLKHEAADARRPAVRKHDLAQARSLGKKITSLKHERAERKAKTGLALAPGDVSCCAAQALAMHAWLATGVRVHDEDVLALYWRTAGDPDEGASILDTLRAAREYGLSGSRPGAFDLISDLDERSRRGARFAGIEDVNARLILRAEQFHYGTVDVADTPHLAEGGRVDHRLVATQELRNAFLSHAGSVILHLDLPEGPHAVTAAPDGTWWSWGEPYSPEDFAGAVIDQAWAVNW